MFRFPEVLILTVAFFVCLYLAYTDIRWKKAPNRYTLGLLLFGLAWQLVFVFYYGTLTIGGLAQIVVESTGIAFLLYYIGAWSPGDAKIYWALAVTIPPSLLQSSSAFVLVANTFVSYFLIIGSYVFLKSSWREKVKVLAELRPRMILKLGYSFIAFMGVSILIGTFLPFEFGYFETIVIFIIFYTFFDRFVKPLWQQAALRCCFLMALYAISRNPIASLEMIGTTLFVFLLCRHILVSLSTAVLSTPVPIAALRPGMLLVEQVVRDREGHCRVQVKQHGSFLSTVRRAKEVEIIVDSRSMGLSEAEVAELQKLAARGGLGYLRVQGFIAFVPLILTGFVLTVLCGQVFVFTILEYIRRVF